MLGVLLDGISKYAFPDIVDTPTGPNGSTLLTYCIALGHSDEARLLLEKGADPQAPDSKGTKSKLGRSPLAIAAIVKSDIEQMVRTRVTQNHQLHVSLFQSIKIRHKDGFEAALGKCPMFLINRIDKSLGLCILLYACRRKPVDYYFIRRIIESHADTSKVNPKNGKNALHYLLKAKPDDYTLMVDVLGHLLAAGTNVNVQESENMCTPVHYAARWCDAGIMRRLLEASADLRLTNRKDRTVLDECISSDCRELVETYLKFPLSSTAANAVAAVEPVAYFGEDDLETQGVKSGCDNASVYPQNPQMIQTTESIGSDKALEPEVAENLPMKEVNQESFSTRKAHFPDLKVSTELHNLEREDLEEHISPQVPTRSKYRLLTSILRETESMIDTYMQNEKQQQMHTNSYQQKPQNIAPDIIAEPLATEMKQMLAGTPSTSAFRLDPGNSRPKKERVRHSVLAEAVMQFLKDEELDEMNAETIGDNQKLPLTNGKLQMSKLKESMKSATPQKDAPVPAKSQNNTAHKNLGRQPEPSSVSSDLRRELEVVITQGILQMYSNQDLQAILQQDIREKQIQMEMHLVKLLAMRKLDDLPHHLFILIGTQKLGKTLSSWIRFQNGQVAMNLPASGVYPAETIEMDMGLMAIVMEYLHLEALSERCLSEQKAERLDNSIDANGESNHDALGSLGPLGCLQAPTAMQGMQLQLGEGDLETLQECAAMLNDGGLLLKLQSIIRKLDKNWKEPLVAEPVQVEVQGLDTELAIATDGASPSTRSTAIQAVQATNAIQTVHAALQRCNIYADYIETCLTLPSSPTDKDTSQVPGTILQESKRWNRTLSFINTKGFDASSAVNRPPDTRISMSTIQRKDTMSSMASLKRSATMRSNARLGNALGNTLGNTLGSGLGNGLGRKDSRRSYGSLQRTGTSGGLAPYHQRYGTGTSLSSFNTRAPSARNSIQTSTYEDCDELEQLSKLRERLEWLQVYDQEEFDVQNQIFKAKVQEWISRVHLTVPMHEGAQEQAQDQDQQQEESERKNRRNGLYLPSF